MEERDPESTFFARLNVVVAEEGTETIKSAEQLFKEAQENLLFDKPYDLYLDPAADPRYDGQWFVRCDRILLDADNIEDALKEVDEEIRYRHAWSRATQEPTDAEVRCVTDIPAFDVDNMRFGNGFNVGQNFCLNCSLLEAESGKKELIYDSQRVYEGDVVVNRLNDSFHLRLLGDATPSRGYNTLLGAFYDAGLDEEDYAHDDVVGKAVLDENGDVVVFKRRRPDLRDNDR